MRFIMLILAFSPALVWLHYFWERGSFRVYYETVLTAVVVGAVVAFPAAFVGKYVIETIGAGAGADVHQYALAMAFFGASFPEEIVKFCAIYLCLSRTKNELRSPYDFVVIGVAVSIGFAALENMFYVGDSENWSLTALFRSLTAVPGHAFTGALMGAFFAFSRTRKITWIYLLLALAVPILLHGLYDYFLFLEQVIRSRHLISAFTLAEFAQLAFILVVCAEGILALVLSERILRDPLKFESSAYPNLTPLVLKKWQQANRLRSWLWFLLSALMILAGLVLGIYLIFSSENYYTLLFASKETGLVSRVLFLIGLCIFSGFHGVTFFIHARVQKRLINKD